MSYDGVDGPCCFGIVVPMQRGGPGPKTAGVTCRRRLKACCLIGSAIRVALRPQSSPCDARERRRCSAWRCGAVYYRVVPFSWSSSVPNAGQWSGSTPAGCEVLQGSLQK
jgi:hypothetical protein